MIWMDVDTPLASVPVNAVPAVDDTDFKTLEAAIAYNAAGMALYWHFTTTAGVTTTTAVTPTTAGTYDWAHLGGGMYSIEIPASGGASINNDTEGFGHFTGVVTGVLPFSGPIIGFRAAALNDSFVDGADSPASLEDLGILFSTTIATLTSQLVFTLTDGPPDDDALAECRVIVTDATTAAQKAIGFVASYIGSTKQVTLTADPGIFTMAAADKIVILPPVDVGRLNGSASAGSKQAAGVTHVLPCTVDDAAFTPTTTAMDVTSLPTLGDVDNLIGRTLYGRTGLNNECKRTISAVADQTGGVYRLTVSAAWPNAASDGDVFDVI